MSKGVLGGIMFDICIRPCRIVRDRRHRPAPSFGEGKRREFQAVTACPPHLRDNDVILLTGFVRTAGEVGYIFIKFRSRSCTVEEYRI